MTQLYGWEPNFLKRKRFRLRSRAVQRLSDFLLDSKKISKIFFLALRVGCDPTQWLGAKIFKIEAFSLAF